MGYAVDSDSYDCISVCGFDFGVRSLSAFCYNAPHNPVVDAFKFLVGLVIGFAETTCERYIIVDGLSRFFLRNLRSERRRKQIPRNNTAFKRESILIIAFYFVASMFVVGFLLG